MSQGKIVLMACGSFSPPTYMHLRMFEIAKDYIHALGLGTVVGGIMSPVHDAYGKKDLVAAHHRISMLRLALRSSSWIKISEWETQQAGWTRTRVSLQYHQDKINQHIALSGINDMDAPSWLPDDVLNVNSIDEPDNLMERLNGNTDGVTIKLLCGADLLESFATPGLWSDDDMEAIVGRHGLVVVTRAGSDPGKFIYESDMLTKHRKNIMLATNYISNEVSSTVIRRLVRRGESAKYLTDDTVLAYIVQNKLYGANSSITEYNYLNEIISFGKRSPQDVIMASPEETSFKNILISIRDKPSIVDETVTVKRQRKSNFLMPNSHTDTVTPIDTIKPKVAYVDRATSNYVPGKAVKIISGTTQHAVKDEMVSLTETSYCSLDSYLSKDDVDFDVYRRRVSEGNVEKSPQTDMKKRCSSTIRKLRPEEIKKSKSEVSKLCDKVKSIKLKENKKYKTRSCNDIVRLILTKHGIHVISDTEAIV